MEDAKDTGSRKPSTSEPPSSKPDLSHAKSTEKQLLHLLRFHLGEMTPQVEGSLLQTCMAVIKSKDEQNQRIVAEAQNLRPIINAIEEDMQQLQSQLKSSKEENDRLNEQVMTLISELEMQRKPKKDRRDTDLNFRSLRKTEGSHSRSLQKAESLFSPREMPSQSPNFTSTPDLSPSTDHVRHRESKFRNPFRESLKFFEDVLSKSADEVRTLNRSSSAKRTLSRSSASKDDHK